MRVRVLWAGGLLLVAAFGFAASYRGVVAPLLLVAAVALPFGALTLGRKLRAGTLLPALLVIVLAAAGAWLALRAGDVAVTDAVPRLLTTPRPAPDTAATLTPTVLLVVLVATLVAAAVLGSDDVRSALLAPVVGAAMLYTATLLLSAGTADPHGITGVARLVIAAAGWSHPYLRGDRTLAWRPAAAVPAAVVAVLALGAGTLAPAGAFDPREHVTPPTVRLSQPSPLTQLRVWGANPDVRILRAKVTGTDRLRLATLDTFSGAAWQVSGDYRQLGLSSRGDLPPATRERDVRATVRLDRLGGVWLPSAGVATASSLDDVLLDPDDGTLAGPGRVRPGLTYDVEARLDAPTSQQLSVAAVPRSVPARYLALPNAPVGFSQYARAAVRGASTPLEEAIALESAVATGRRLDPKAVSGSSYGRLSTFLFAPAGTAGASVGSVEQFAAAFAVLGRAVGLPTRLVVGFDLPDAGGTVTVRGRDATAWPEVYLQGTGWVAFSPTPGSDDSAAGGALRDDVLQRLSERAEKLPPATPPVTPTTAPGGAAPTTPPAARPASRDDGGLPGWALALVVAAAVLLFVLVLVAGLRVLRTRRHRRRGARGAWAELVDLLVLVDRRPDPGRPAPEIAADALALLGEPAAVVAAAADREAFAPGGGPATPVWGHLRVLRRRARTSLPRYRRVLLPLDPRPLVRR